MINIQNVSASAYGAQSFQPTTTKGSGKKDPPQQPSSSKSAKVELSDASMTMNKLREKIDALPEVRIQLVENIKQRIEHDDYPFTTNLYKAVDNMMANNLI
jgi:anti-sigma28 factor (negative regulator of flagellin synthesis)